MAAFEIIVVAPSSPRRGFTTPALAIAAARAGAVGLIDIEFVNSCPELTESLDKLAGNAMGGTVGVRVRSGVLCWSASDSRVGGLPVEEILTRLISTDAVHAAPVMVLTAGVGQFNEELLAKDVKLARHAGFRVFVEVVDLKEAQLAESCGADGVIAKGHEASGRVGDTTTFVLVQQFARNLRIPFWAQGGIGCDTAAAVAAAGAQGVVLDSQLYLTSDSLIPFDVQTRFEKLDGTETTLLSSLDGNRYFRLLTANGTSRFADLENLAKDTFQQKLTEFLENNVVAQQESDECWIVGQDSCLAKRLALKGGTVAGVIADIRDSIELSLEYGAKGAALSEGSELAISHGTRYPIVQGAMTRVSDTSEFALKVAEGGGLPFLALSLMRGKDIELLLQETAEKLGQRPWGVGILGFVPQQLRQEQMEVVNRHKPPFALIAGGRPDQAKALDAAGTATYLHVPSPLLLGSFIEMGSRRFIFEGKECGGHVGPRASFVLWQSMIDVLLESIGPRDNPQTFHLLFAGGIHDDLSAAMVAAMASPLSRRGIKIGALLGTAYLFTEEAVTTGAIVSKFQKAALDCDETVLLETGPGHSIRCIDSPYKSTFDSLHSELKEKKLSRDEIREELELMNLGRLRIASKGLERGSSDKLEPIAEDKQWQDGMYMIGQVASMHESVTTIPELHALVCEGSTRILSELKGSWSRDSGEREERPEGIAIVGMSCMFPKGNDMETYWNNILNKVDAISEIPSSHFDWKNYYDANPQARDKIVSKWGGFLPDAIFDPAPYGIPPNSLDSIDAMQVLILDAASRALVDAGYSDRKFPREKTSVILANAGHGPITALYSLRSMLGWKLSDLSEGEVEKIKQDLPEWTEDSFAGYLGNVTAGRVANRLDLKGINFSIDAACASSLAALYVGIADLRAGNSDVVLLGATDTHNQPGDYLSFSKTHALSPSGRCQTFDAKADGIVISEGIAMLVLKRLSDAERAGDKIYAVIRGIGGSSDGRDLSLTAPRPAGQMLALRRAYEDAGISPSTVGLIEAHGTGTVAGDKAEVEALTKVFQQSGAKAQSCAIGSVKTNIGHTKAAAGLASIVKVAKALNSKTLPPTINVQQPNPACHFDDGPFYLNTESRPWFHHCDQTPRRAGVSAFGFGGTNFHTILEEYTPPCPPDERPAIEVWPCELFVWKGSSKDEILRAVKQTEAAVAKIQSEMAVATEATSERQRKLFLLAHKSNLRLNDVSLVGCALAIVASSLDDLAGKLSQAKEIVEKDQPASLKSGIHYNNVCERKGKIAFLFPGQGSQRIDMLRDLSVYFPELRSVVEKADRVLKSRLAKPLSSYIYPIPALTDSGKREQSDALTRTEVAQPALGACDLAIFKLLTGFGLRPDMVAGHSYGEYVALFAAGVFSEQQLLEVSAERGRILSECAASAPGAMAAVAADPQTVQREIAKFPDVYLANVNTPSQCIISGATASIESALSTLTDRNIACKKIPVSAAFHSPLLKASRAPLSSYLKKQTLASPKIPVFSNTTAQPYSEQPGAIAIQLSEHALKPVLFADQLNQMYESGARIFVEVGPGNVLTGLAEATLKDKGVIAVSSERSRESLHFFLNLLAQLTVHGGVARLALGKLFWNRMARSLREREEPVETTKKARLLYRVNSAAIERIGRTEQKKDAQNVVNRLALSTNGSVRMESERTSSSAIINSASASGNGSSDRAKVFNQTGANTGEKNVVGDARDNGASNGNNGTGRSESILQPHSRSESKGMKPNNSQSIQPSRTAERPLPRATGDQSQFAPVSSGPAAGSDASIERVMLEFQKSMLEMTNRFLDAQQKVMLAYLQSGRVTVDQQHGLNGHNPAQPLVPGRLELTPSFPQNNGKHPTTFLKENDLALQMQFEPPLPEFSGLNGTSDNHKEPGHVVSLVEQPVDNCSADNGTLNTDQLIDSLFEIVSERTGYPRQMLDPNLDLEADLGIDSIKRVEILNNFRKLLPEVTQEKLESGIEKLAGTKTLQGIIDWIRSLGEDSTPTKSLAPAVVPVKNGNVDNVARGLVTVKTLSVPTRTKKTLAPQILLVGGQSGLSAAIAANLKRHDQITVQLSASDVPVDEDGLMGFLQQFREKHGPIGSLIYLGGFDADSKSNEREWSSLKQLFLLTKSIETELNGLGAKGHRSSILTVTKMGGTFGVNDMDTTNAPEHLIEQAALAGLTKTIAKELPSVHVKVVDVSSAAAVETLAAGIVAELYADDDIVEIGLDNGNRIGLAISESNFSQLQVQQPLALTPSSVVLVTGGARGITAEVVLDLARRYQPSFVIVGRIPRPAESESPVTAGLETQKDIKAAIIDEMQRTGKVINVRDVERVYQQLLREREVRDTLAKLKAAGSTVRYHSVDVTDEAAFSRLIDSIYETSSIDGVIQGAGIIEDALIKAKSLSSFERVFNTKVQSALTLAKKIRFEDLQFMYLFSSVVGRTGNSGQSDYVAANEALNKLALRLRRANQKCRIASLMWGPWQAGMAPPELEQVFASHGWSMIQPEDGCACFHEELTANVGDHVEVLLVGKLKSAGVSAPPLDSNISPAGVIVNRASLSTVAPPTFNLSIDTGHHHYLHDHKFDGIPVMPMAVALETMLEAAQSVYPERHLVKVSNLDIPAGVVFHTPQKEFSIEVTPDSAEGEVTLQLAAAGPSRKVHFRCKAQFAQAPNMVPEKWITSTGTQIPRLIGPVSSMKSELALPQPKDVYGKWLFHGPIFQGIQDVQFLAEDGITGNVIGGAPVRCVSTADNSDWIVDPVLLDSAMQLAGIWARHYRDVTVLPTGFKTMHLFGRRNMPTMATAQIFLNPAMATELLCDLAIYDSNNELCFVVEGLGGIASKNFNRFSSSEAVRELAQ